MAQYVDQARLNSEHARMELEKHTGEHHCFSSEAVLELKRYAASS